MTDELAAFFFYDHAGYSWRPGEETEEEGRIRCARALADAEALAKECGFRFEWEDDWTTRDHVAAFPDAYDSQPDTCETCIAYNARGDIVGVLGCINDADDNYRRVIEAELADEALAPMVAALASDGLYLLGIAS